MYNRIGLRTCW